MLFLKLQNIHSLKNIFLYCEKDYKKIPLELDGLEIEKGDILTKLTWNTIENFSYVWISLDEIYDM